MGARLPRVIVMFHEKIARDILRHYRASHTLLETAISPSTISAFVPAGAR
jgi:hypothetical protein